jgi:hypothetical protein
MQADQDEMKVNVSGGQSQHDLFLCPSICRTSGGVVVMASRDGFSESVDIGRVLTRGIQTIGRQFVVFLGVAILLGAIPSAAMTYWQYTALGASDPANPLERVLSPIYWATILVSILSSFLVQAALVRASIMDLKSEPVELGPLLVRSLVLLVPLIVLSIVSFLAIGIGFALFLVPGIILSLMWIVAVPAMVEEGCGIFASLSRSAELTKGSRWWILLLVIMYFVVSAVVGSTSVVVAFATNSLTGPVLLGYSVVVSTIVGMVSAAMLASLYIELRLVKEGGSSDSLEAIFA